MAKVEHGGIFKNTEPGAADELRFLGVISCHLVVIALQGHRCELITQLPQINCDILIYIYIYVYVNN